jgi:branched-chain amino acid transport system substrate-binding protein
MKAVHYIVVVLVVVVLVTLYGTSKKSEDINLLALLPLSGGNAEQGIWVKRGLEIALDEVNTTSRNKINLIFEDTQGVPKNAVGIYTDVTSRYKVPVIFTWGSGVGIALTPLVNKDKVVQFGLATASTAYSSPDDYTFRNFPAADLESKFFVDSILNTLGQKKVAILKINNDYGQSSAKTFAEQYIKAGGTVVAEEGFEPGEGDFRSILTKIKFLNPGMIYIASYPKEGSLILRQSGDLNIQSKFVASVAVFGGKDFFDTAGKNIEGLIIANSVPIANLDSQEALNFSSKYEEKYKEKVSPQQQLYSIRAYDGLKIISKLIDSCGDSSECVKEGLYNTKHLGIGGEIVFDRNGDVQTNFELQYFKGGKFVKLLN